MKDNLRDSFIVKMLKICKHDFLESRALIIMAIILTCANILFLLNDESSPFLIFAFILLLPLFAVSCYFGMASNFHKKVFGKEAYFTHSLPVSIDCLLISKIIVFSIWELIIIAETVVPIIILARKFDIYYEEAIYQLILSICTGLADTVLVFAIVSIVHKAKHPSSIGILIYIATKIALMSMIAAIVKHNASDSFGILDLQSIAFSIFIFDLAIIIASYALCRWIINNKLSL